MSNSQPQEEENTHFLEIYPTCNYGLVTEKSTRYYSFDSIPKNKLLDYRISKIRCQLKSSTKSITGLQIFAINRNNSTEKTLINVEFKETPDIEQEFSLDNLEYITDMKIWKNERLMGFEISTNKGNSKKFGYDNNEPILVPDLIGGGNIVVAFYVCADDEGVSSLTGFFLDGKKYNLAIYSGIFYLKLKIKDEGFRKKMEGKLSDMDEKLQILYRVCSLPDNSFFNIVKFALS